MNPDEPASFLKINKKFKNNYEIAIFRIKVVPLKAIPRYHYI